MVKTKAKRLLSLLLAFAMVLSLTVTPVYAADDDTSDGSEASETSGESSTSEDYVDEIEQVAAVATEDDVVDATEEPNAGITMIDEDGGSSTASELPEAVSGVITLTQDVALANPYIVSDSVTIDLKGYSITRGSGNEYSNLFAVGSGATLIIQDTSEGAKGTIYSENFQMASDSTKTYAGYGIRVSGGTVTVKSGTVSGYYGIWVASGSLTVEGGTVTGTSVAVIQRGGTVSVTGGTIGGSDCNRGLEIVAASSDTTTSITGGTVSATDLGIYVSDSTYAATLTIGTSGDTSTTTPSVSGTGYGGIYATTGAEVIVNSGSVTGDSAILVWGGESSANNTTLTVTGGSISGTTFGVVTNGSTYYTSITVNDGSISGAYGMYLPAMSSTTVINGGTITGSTTGIEIRAGSLTVTGGTITSTSSEFDTSTNGSGTTVVGAGIAVSQHSTNKEVTVTITGGDISGYYGVYEMNTYANNTSKVTVTISGDDTTVTATSDDGEAVCSTTDNDYTSVTVSGGTYSTDVTEYITAASEDYVAAIVNKSGTVTQYKSLKDVSSALADGDTVLMVANSYDSPFTLDDSDFAVTLDLNGYSINMSSSAAYPRTPITVTNGSLTIIDSSETEDEDGNVIYTGTVAAGANSSQGAVYNEGGTVTIEGGNYYAQRTYTAAIVTNSTSAETVINGGTVTGNTYALQVTCGSMTINGGSFNSALGTAINVATESGTDESVEAGTSGSCIMVRKDGAGSATLTIKNGYFKCGTSFTDTSSDATGQAIISTSRGDATDDNVHDATISISGGVFSSNRYSSVSDNLAAGCALSFISDIEDSDYQSGYRFKVGLNNYLLGHYATAAEAEAAANSSLNEGDFVTDSGYTTAKAAITAASATNNVIVVNVESDEDSPITTAISVTNTDVAITLDLNGCYISTSGTAISVAAGGTLTIVDSEGSATVISSVGQAGTVRNYGGTLTIEGGTYVQTKNDESSSSKPLFTFVVYTAASSSGTTVDSDNVSTTINGGTFTNENGYAFGSYIGSLSITGGYMSAYSLLYKSANNNSDDPTITGGYFNNDPTSYVADNYEVATNESAETYQYYVADVIVGRNIDLASGVISMNVYIAGNLENGTSSVTLSPVSSSNVLNVTTYEGTDIEADYVLSQNVVAKKMADEWTVNVTLADGYVVVYKTSIQDYADTLLADTTGLANNYEKAVLTAMLNYGAAVQTYSSYNTDSPANANCAYTSDELNGITVSGSKTTESSGGYTGPTLKSVSMTFSEDFTLKLTFTGDVSSYTLVVKNGDTNISADASSTKVTISDLSALDLNNTFEIKLTSGSDTYTVTMSGLYYAYLLSTQTNTNYVTLGKTIYQYATTVNTLASTTSSESETE